MLRDRDFRETSRLEQEGRQPNRGGKKGRPRPSVEEADNKVKELKRAIGDVYAFVSQYVELDARGRGSCPFHPPGRHPSFAVNREQAYWGCLHPTNPQTGHYLGGDAIEFYRWLKGLSFKEAVRDLADQYGVTGLPF